MKWYFAANRNALRDAFDQIKVAVISASVRTDLKPVCLIEEHEGLAELADNIAWLKQAGVTLTPHRAELFKFIRDHFGPRADIFSGHWLRCDIPLVEANDEFVLYTDIDVMFVKSIDHSVMKPVSLACAPEFRRDDFSYFNSGVMVMNLPFLRTTRDWLIRNLKNRIESMRPHDDQGLLNAAYRYSWERLPNTWNWKPYWGCASDAAIVHFHGPKPGDVKRMLSGELETANRDCAELFRLNPDGYSAYIADFDSFLMASNRV